MIPSCITYAPTQHSLHAWLRLAVLSLRFLPPTNAPVIMLSIASVCVFLVAFVPTLTSRQPTPLPLLSYIPNSTTANLCTLTSTQTNRLQHIQNFLARTVASPPKYSHNHPCSWISLLAKIEQRIQYKLISVTYRVLTTSQPIYRTCKISFLFKLTIILVPLIFVIFVRPSAASSLKITDRSFQHASSHLCNKLPISLWEPFLPVYAYLNPSFSSPLSSSTTPSLFHIKLKTYLFGKSFPT